TVSTFTVSLPEVTSTDILKDSFAMRLFVYSNPSDKLQLDAGYLTGSLMYDNGTQAYNTFTEYEVQRESHEPAANASPSWALGQPDGPGAGGITLGGNTDFPVSGSFTTSKYLEFDQTPTVNFIPAGAVVTSSSISLYYYEDTGSNTMCAEILGYVSGVLKATS